MLKTLLLFSLIGIGISSELCDNNRFQDQTCVPKCNTTVCLPDCTYNYASCVSPCFDSLWYRYHCINECIGDPIYKSVQKDHPYIVCMSNCLSENYPLCLVNCSNLIYSQVELDQQNNYIAVQVILDDQVYLRALISIIIGCCGAVIFGGICIYVCRYTYKVREYFTALPFFGLVGFIILTIWGIINRVHPPITFPNGYIESVLFCGNMN